MYLWCPSCERVHSRDLWTLDGRFAHGVCPTPLCGGREYRTAVAWQEIAKAHGYEDEPIEGGHYPVDKLVF